MIGRARTLGLSFKHFWPNSWIPASLPAPLQGTLSLGPHHPIPLLQMRRSPAGVKSALWAPRRPGLEPRRLVVYEDTGDLPASTLQETAQLGLSWRRGDSLGPHSQSRHQSSEDFTSLTIFQGSGWGEGAALSGSQVLGAPCSFKHLPGCGVGEAGQSWGPQGV